MNDEAFQTLFGLRYLPLGRIQGWRAVDRYTLQKKHASSADIELLSQVKLELGME